MPSARRSALLAASLALTAAAGTLAGGAVPAVGAVPAGTIAALRDLPTPRTSAYERGNWSAPDVVHTYLEADGDVGVATVDLGRERVVVDSYDAATGAREGEPTTIEFGAYPLFGGLYTAPGGEHFLMLGRGNAQEVDDREVIAVRRFTADWTADGTATLRGGVEQGTKGVAQPFDAGGGDLLQVGGKLVAHVARSMYAGSDGVNHQGDLTFEVDLTTMKARPFSALGDAPYSSHSFNQLLATSSNRLLLLDHGDAYPRAVQLSVMAGYPTKRSVESHKVFALDGETGDNRTGTFVTGLVADTDRALVVGTSVPHRHAVDGVRGFGEDLATNVFAISVDPATGTDTFRWLTEFSPTGAVSAGEPRVTTLPDGRQALLFTVFRAGRTDLEYRLLDTRGQVLASRTWADASFSPVSEPLVVGDHLVWVQLDADDRTGVSGPVPSYLAGLDLTDPTKPTRLGSAEEVLGTDATLQRVKVSGGTLAPAFSPATRTYRVTTTRKWVGVTATASDPSATLEYRLSGYDWTTTPFSVGMSKGGRGTVTVRVTAEDGTTRQLTTFWLYRKR